MNVPTVFREKGFYFLQSLLVLTNLNVIMSSVLQSRGDSGHRRNGMYYGTPFYGGYGYASPVPHPNVYAAAYGAYPFYGNQQLVS